MHLSMRDWGMHWNWVNKNVLRWVWSISFILVSAYLCCLQMLIDVLGYRAGFEKQGRGTQFDNCGVEKEFCFFTRETCKRRIRYVGERTRFWIQCGLWEFVPSWYLLKEVINFLISTIRRHLILLQERKRQDLIWRDHMPLSQKTLEKHKRSSKVLIKG